MTTPDAILKPRQLQLPVVTLDGTTRAELIREHVECAEALRNAAAIIGGRMPHDRDYYASRLGMQGELAREAFRARMEKLREWAKEFEAVALALHDRGAGK